MSQTPLVVRLSARCYRMLVNAYPGSFRREYGEPMAQLFQDMAVDAYRLRGLLGLLGVWFGVIVDLVASAIRLNFEEVVLRINTRRRTMQNEPLSLRYVLSRWLALAMLGVAVVALSVRYVLQLPYRRLVWYVLQFPYRRPMLFTAGLSLVVLGLWGWSYYKTTHGYSSSLGATLEVRNGSVLIRQFHKLPMMTELQCRANPGTEWMPLPAAPAWEFSFSSGHRVGSASAEARRQGMFDVSEFWEMRVPMGIVSVILLLLLAALALNRFIRRHPSPREPLADAGRPHPIRSSDDFGDQVTLSIIRI